MDIPLTQESDSTNTTEERSKEHHESDVSAPPASTHAHPVSRDNSQGKDDIARESGTSKSSERPDTDITDSRSGLSHEEKDEVRRRSLHVDTVSKPVGNSTVQSSSTSKPVQMVLSTANASWNLRRAAVDSSDRPAKRHKLDHTVSVTTGQRASLSKSAELRKQLLGFARSGSQLAPRHVLEVEDEDRDQDTAMVLDDLGSDAEGEVEGGEPSVLDVPDQNKAAAHQSGLAPDTEITMAVEGAQEQIETDSPTVNQPRGDQFEGSVERHQQNSQAKSPRKLQKGVPRLQEIIRTIKGNDISINLDFTELDTSWKELQTHLASSTSSTGSADSHRRDELSRDAGIETDDDKAQEALSRIIDKSDFLTMNVIGQFNRGFIIARRRKHDGPGKLDMDDLFIIDQHAADEKYNFEQLQETTRIESQKLIR